MVQAHPEEMSAPHHPGFFQRKSVQTVLPFMTSLALHAGIVALALTVYQAVTIVMVPQSEYGGPVDSNFDNRNDITPVSKNLFAGTENDSTRPPGQIFEMVDVDPASLEFKPGSAEQVNLNPGGSDGGESQSTLIGTGPGSGKKGTGIGFGIGDGIGDGTGLGHKGPAGRIGPPGGGGPVFPETRGARKIVYVCDATGSMTPVFSGLRQALGDEIDRLGKQNVQFFNVLFFSDDRVLSLSPSLLKADKDTKARATDFFNNTTSRGMTNPLPAIRQAFAQNPELIYVLTDGFDQVSDLETVVREFDTLNKDRSVRVNTILIGTSEQKELVDVLQRIAKENGGTMRIVSKEDF